jgi:hypothetical protein
MTAASFRILESYLFSLLEYTSFGLAQTWVYLAIRECSDKFPHCH